MDGATSSGGGRWLMSSIPLLERPDLRFCPSFLLFLVPLSCHHQATPKKVPAQVSSPQLGPGPSETSPVANPLTSGPCNRFPPHSGLSCCTRVGLPPTPPMFASFSILPPRPAKAVHDVAPLTALVSPGFAQNLEHSITLSRNFSPQGSRPPPS